MYVYVYVYIYIYVCVCVCVCVCVWRTKYLLNINEPNTVTVMCILFHLKNCT